MSDSRIIIIGGGPAGLMAGGQIASLGIETILLEKMPVPGRKLRITGKGRCNLTNIAPLRDFISHFGKNGKFLHQAFNRFFSEDLVEFLADIGVKIKVERGGRVFPEGEDAVAVAKALEVWARREGVSIRSNSKVTGLLIEENRVKGVKLGSNVIRSSAVILATGGLSYPATGSTGDGYLLAKKAGHRIINTYPSLVPLVTSGGTAKRLQGLSLRNVSITTYIDEEKKETLFGEMLFTHFGLSGPIILSASRRIVKALDSQQRVSLSIDLKPALDENKLDARLLREMQEHSNRNFSTLLKTLLPSKMIPVCIEQTDIASDKRGNQITVAERMRLRRWLKDLRFEIQGYRGYDKAIVTSGGIDLKEINPRTMESKIILSLFFAGEVIDIDGDTGGYNLQASFSTGWLAGRSAVESIQ